jgi:hypothetical protein
LVSGFNDPPEAMLAHLADSSDDSTEALVAQPEHRMEDTYGFAGPQKSDLLYGSFLPNRWHDRSRRMDDAMGESTANAGK